MDVKFNSKTTVQVKFHLSGKDTDVKFNNKTTVPVKFHLSGKDTDVQFNNKTTVQVKITWRYRLNKKRFIQIKNTTKFFK